MNGALESILPYMSKASLYVYSRQGRTLSCCLASSMIGGVIALANVISFAILAFVLHNTIICCHSARVNFMYNITLHSTVARSLSKSLASTYATRMRPAMISLSVARVTRASVSDITSTSCKACDLVLAESLSE